MNELKFEVKIVASDRSRYAVHISQSETGIMGLDLAREESGIENLRPDLVISHIGEIGCDPVIEITEQIARESGLFQNKNRVQVEVAPHQLNWAVRTIVRVNRCAETGEVKRAWLERRLDTAAVVEAWASAGYPTKWEIEEANDEDEEYAKYLSEETLERFRAIRLQAGG